MAKFLGPVLDAKSLTLTTDLAVAEGGTAGHADPIAGSIAYGTGSALAYSTAGTAGQVLTSDGAAIPTWTDHVPIHVSIDSSPPEDPATDDLWLVTDQGADLTTPTAGGITYGDGSNYQVSPAGTSGQILTSTGSGAPTWTDPVTLGRCIAIAYGKAGN